MKGYYFITDRHLSKHGNKADVEAANAAGAVFIQYREKELGSRIVFQKALELKALCRKSRFIVNDRIDIVLAVDADGVHLGQEDLPVAVARKLLGKKKIIGITVNSLDEARSAAKDGADYLGVSPVFSTQTKVDAGPARGISLIIEVKNAVKIPVVAIGGIHLLNAPSVIKAGADMICAISAVVTQDDVASAIREFQELFL